MIPYSVLFAANLYLSILSIFVWSSDILNFVFTNVVILVIISTTALHKVLSTVRKWMQFYTSFLKMIVKLCCYVFQYLSSIAILTTITRNQTRVHLTNPNHTTKQTSNSLIARLLPWSPNCAMYGNELHLFGTHSHYVFLAIAVLVYCLVDIDNLILFRVKLE